MARTAPAPNIPPIPGMCPGIAVLGGGGDGGGGSGKGSKNGKGKKKGKTSKKKKKGDPKEKKGCGGKKGSCTGCSKKPSAGEPVDVISGEVYTMDYTDLELPGFFDITFDRSYSTANRARDIGLGWGWTHNFVWDFRVKGRRVYVSGNGGETDFPVMKEPGYQSSAGAWGLLSIPGGYVLRPGSEFMHYFTPDAIDPSVYRLREIRYRNRGSIYFEYDSHGVLTRITDTAGRIVVLATHHGRITSISVTQPGGSTIVFARYTYDAGGFLIAATDADGNTFRFAYDDDRRLIDLRYPNDLTFHYRYDRQGRCVESWGDYPGGVDPALSADVSPTLADGTPAKGIFHCKLEFAPEYTEVVDSVRVQRYFADPETGLSSKGVNGIGGVTTRIYDDAGNDVTRIDPNEGASHYEYNGKGDLIKEVDAEGHVIQLKRDGESRITEVTDPLGGKVLTPRDVWGNVELMQRQNGGVETFRYNDRGRLVEHIDARGARTKLEYDAHANIVAETYPNGATFRYVYDFWGRKVITRPPTGGEYRYTYSEAGRLLYVVDPIGRTKSYEYDALGNQIAVTTPDGATTRAVYAGLSWPITEIQPNGARLEQRFNREGWLVELFNEKGERSTFKHDHAGNVVEEVLFNGRTLRYTRDVMGSVIAIEDGDRKTEIKRNLVNQITEIVNPDGVSQFLEYDARGELIAARQPGAEFEWELDAIGEVLRETHRIGDATYVIDNQRDPAGMRTGFRTSLGLDLRVQRDHIGDVVRLDADGQAAVAYTRNEIGAPVRREFPRGGAQVDEYDAVGRLIRRSVLGAGAAAAGTPEWVGNASAGSIQKTYQYTPVDEIASVTTADDGTTEFTYDVRRAVRRKLSNDGRTEQYQVDATGNYLTPNNEFDTGDRIVRHRDIRYTHDDRGFLVEKRVPRTDGEEDVTQFVWDGFDLLRAVELPDGRRVEFDYDAFARRVAKRVVRPDPVEGDEILSTTHFVWDLLNVVHEVDVATSQTRTFLYEDNQFSDPIGERSGDGWLHYVGDQKERPEEIVDDAGRQLGKLERDTFGGTREAGGSTVSTPFRDPGQYADAETGLYYNRYRYYDPEIGRFISPDPIHYEGGFNLYAYGPNPIGWMDPMGWTHGMNATWTPGDMGGEAFSKTYASGMGKDCPKYLKSQAKCHTERKFLHDLQKSGKQGGKAKCTGQLPPCPNCHRAMQQHADQSGTEIKYEWETDKGPPKKMDSITYKPNSPPTGKGDSAQALTGANGQPGAYSMQQDPDNKYGYKFDKWSNATEGYTDQKKNATAWDGD